MAETKGRTKMGEEKAGGAARGKAQHTPGPWEVVGHYVRTWRGNSAGIEVARVDFTDSYTDKPTREANAKLIAAAPALADALHGIVADFDSDNPGDFGRLIDAGRAALRAAGLEASTASAPKEPPEPTPDPEAQR